MTARSSPSTMKGRATRSGSSRSASARASSPAASISAFIADGGYRRAEFWLSEGWATVQREGWTAPLYWRERAAAGRLHPGRAAARSTRPSRSCHVSYYEADAYARWARQAPADRGGMGSGGGSSIASPLAGNLMDRGIYHPQAAADGRAGADGRRRVGMDAEPLCRATRASGPLPARSASTTASSWSTRWCCAAARR